MELEEPCVTSNSLFCFLQREQTVLLISDENRLECLTAILASPVSSGILAENACSAMINLLRSKLSIPFHSIATSNSPSLSKSISAMRRMLGEMHLESSEH